MIGVYTITNKKNGRLYIGASIKINQRWYEHLCTLRKNQHRNHQLQQDWNRQQEYDFEFAFIHECKANNLRELETQTIRELQRTHNMYNRSESDPEAARQARITMSADDWRHGVSIAQAAKKLNMTERTVRNWIEEGAINAYKLNPYSKSVYRIPATEVQRILRARAKTQGARSAL
jgi:excisionase family DNA binding protein